MIRNIVLAATVALSGFAVSPVWADDPGQLTQALRLATARDWTAAGDHARASGPLAVEIVTWQRLRAGQGQFDEYQGFLLRHPDWPGLPLLQKRGERAIGNGADPASVIAYFSGTKPQTGAGSLALVAALKAQGRTSHARAEAVRAWRALSLDADDQAAFLEDYSETLKDHHGGRMNNMLWAGNIRDARAMQPLVTSGTRGVAAARIALMTNAKGVDAVIADVPERMMGSAGLAYDRFRWRIRKDRYDEAGALMLERSVSAESLGDPEAWSDWRRRLARREMRLGDAGRAYEMATQHHLSEGSSFADLEWLAGYIALRKLGNANTALTHFNRFAKAVGGPISLSRAGYWQGRALEALGRPNEALAAYGEAARYQTAFYGLLAAEKVGLPLSPALTGGEIYPDWRGTALSGSYGVSGGPAIAICGQPATGTAVLAASGRRPEWRRSRPPGGIGT